MLPDNMCYTCLSKEKGDLTDLQRNDADKTSYKQKLMICLSNNLEEFSKMQMCESCIKYLRISYDFVKMVQETQESLKHLNEESIQKGKYKKECTAKQSDNTDYLLLELRNNATDLFSCNKCDKHEMNSNEYVEHMCEVKDEVVIKFDGVTENYFSNAKGESKQDQMQKMTQKVKNKVLEDGVNAVVYKCKLCEQIFTKQGLLTKHMTQIHKQDRRYFCSYCSKAFKQSYHLREHMTMHTGERNFACQLCEKTFFRASSHRRHVRAHEAPVGQKTKRTPFLCTICGKSFPFSNGVQRHMRVHFGIKKFECQLCGRKFMQSTHLNVHMRTHTGEKPYICDICGDAFSLNCSLQKHLNIHKNPRIKIEEINEIILAE